MRWQSGRDTHQARDVAESFGVDAERYHRTRPRYPDGLYERILAEAPGRRILDVGSGTGIVATELARRGAQVLGVEADARMAEFAAGLGVATEVARFEDWVDGGRSFDAVVAGTAWHWVDPDTGPGRAADALAPGGLISLFWNVRELDPDISAAFAELYARETPEAPFARGMAAGAEAYEPILTRASDGLVASERFGPTERWRWEWSTTTTRQDWLDQLATFGGHNLIDPDAYARLAEGMGVVIDAAGGSIEIRYVTMAVSARRA